MIPTKENIAKVQKQRRQAIKLKVHTKIADTFIENAINNSNLSALKTIYYLSTILDKEDIKNIQEDKIKSIKIDKREMLKYTEMTAPTLVKVVKQMQQTSITFTDEAEGIIEGMSLLPRYKFVPNKNIVELDLYVRIAKMIIEVKEQYTMMNIKEIMKLKRANSVRMLALLNMMNKTKTSKSMTLNELNAFFGVNYRNWNEIERKVIKPVKEELDTHSTKSFKFEANYEALGRGRPAFKNVTIEVIKNINLFTQ